VKPRAATAEECAAIWPAIAADHLIDSPEGLRDYHAAGPWRVRVAGRGEASLLGPWRLHLDVLSMRGVWCAERHVGAFAEDAVEMASAHGFGRVLSPLLPVGLLGGYHRAGMRDLEPIVAIQGTPDRLRSVAPPEGASVRVATPEDLPALAVLDEECFDDFWRYSADELVDLMRHERCAIARTAEGELIGYTLATVSRGAAVLSRLCAAPGARRRGIGSMLLSDVGAWARESGATTIALCTQEANVASRALYASAGLVELHQRYGLAMREV